MTDQLDQPLFLTAPPGDAGRLFVAEKTGRVRVIRGGTLLTTAFLDLSTLVSGGGEQGLLGLAFHPDYSTNGLFYVSYTNVAGDSRVVRYRVSANADVADAGSGDTVLAVVQPFSNHNGGMIAFGPDGYLYVGLGDGGSANDPQENGQSLATLLGKLLRLDVDGAPPYTVPADNPFVGQAGARGEIWAYGLRNPWRFSFDRSTGGLYIGDVGQGAWEEVDFRAAGSGGANYGWDVMEGAHCFEPPVCDPSGLVLPVHEYANGGGTCAVTGGYVYRGSRLPSLQGHYFYSDYCAGFIRSFRIQNGQAADHRNWTVLNPGSEVSSFGEDAASELYVMTLGGRLYRFEAGAQ